MDWWTYTKLRLIRQAETTRGCWARARTMYLLFPLFFSPDDAADERKVVACLGEMISFFRTHTNTTIDIYCIAFENEKGPPRGRVEIHS